MLRITEASISKEPIMSVLRIWAGWFLVLGCTLAAAAQEPAAGNDEADAENGTIREQTIYVPYSKLRTVFEQKGRGVFLPYEEFQKLWKQARAALEAEPDERPPVDALITEINSQAVVEEEVVRVNASLKVEVLSKGWHEIPLRLGDSAILAAAQGDQPARITFEPNTGYRLLVHKKTEEPEQLEFTLRYSKSFAKSPGQNTVSFQAPQAPINQWQIRIPQAGVKVNVRPLVAATEAPAEGPEAAAAEETVVLAFVGAAPSVQIDWTPKAEGATGLEALATVQTEQQVTIDEGVIRTRTQLIYTISRAELTQLAIETPADHKVLNVFDPNVREWTVVKNGEANKISVQLYEPARETQRITVEMEKFSDTMLQEAVVIPTVKASGVGRQQGVIVVRIASTLRAETAARAGLLQLDAGELPGSLAGGAWQFSYRYPTLPYELSLNVEKVQPQIRTHELVEAYLEPERLTLNLLALYEIERAGVFQLELDVPEGFEVRNVRGHAAAEAQAVVVDAHHRTGENNTRLVVNLARKAIGKVGLFVELQRRLEDPNLLSPTGEVSQIPLPLPRVAPSGVEQSKGRLLVYAPESLRVNPIKQEGLQTISFAEALEGSASTRGGRFGAAREVLAYSYTQSAVDLLLAVERRKPYITARQLLLARVEAGVIKYEATLFYDIRYSGVKSLRLDVPAELASEIRNQTPTVAREAPLDPQPDDVDAGDVAWSLTGETEFLGEVSVKFAWERKIGELEVGKSVDEALPRLQPKNVDRAWGQIVIAKAETLDVRPAGEPSGLRPIDPQHDLMPGARVADAARAFEFYGDWDLTMTIARYELIEVKRTSIERAVVRMEVTRSGVISVQALYRIRSARQRLPLLLPAAVDFDTDPLRINGRSVSLERGDQDEYFVPLAGRNADEPFLMEVRYTAPGSYRRLDLPEFPSDPAVQKVYLCAYVPQERKVIGSRGPWTDEMAWRWYEMLGGLPRSLQTDDQLVAWVIEGLGVPNPFGDFTTDGRLHTFSTLQPAPPPDGSLRLVAVHENALNVVVFLAVILVGLLVLRRPLPQKLAVVALLVVLLLIAGVFAPILARQVLGGALLSAVLVVVAAWLVWHAAQGYSALTAAALRRRLRREQQAAGASHTEAASPEPAAAGDSESAGSESPFQTPTPADATGGEQKGEAGGQGAEDQQEGGRSDA
jgi:hypothetical protein